MRYLTKKLYNLCQMTGLHFGMRSHKGTYHKMEFTKRQDIIQSENIINLPKDIIIEKV